MIYDLLIKSLKMGFKQKGYKKKILQMLPSRKIPVTVTTPSFHGSNVSVKYNNYTQHTRKNGQSIIIDQVS